MNKLEKTKAANEANEALTREIKQLLNTQHKIVAGNHRKKKKLREANKQLEAECGRLREFVKGLPSADLALHVNDLLKRLEKHKYFEKELRSQNKAWRGAAEALFSAFWEEDKEDSELCKWLVGEARKNE